MPDILGTWTLTDEDGNLVPAFSQPGIIQNQQFAYTITFSEGGFAVETHFAIIEDVEGIVYHYEAMRNLPGRGLYEKPANAEFVRALRFVVPPTNEEVLAAMEEIGEEARFYEVRTQILKDREVRHEIYRIRQSGTLTIIGDYLIQLEDEFGNTWIFEVERNHRDLTLTTPLHIFTFRLR